MTDPTPQDETRAAARTLRTRVVWSALIGAMTLVGGGLLLSDPSPAGLGSSSGVTLSPLAAVARPSSLEPIFQTAQGFEPARWDAIVIHHTATPGATPEGLDEAHRAMRLEGLGYHMVVGNGVGMGEGEIHVGARWLAQQPGAHVAGPMGAELNRTSVGICLVGDGDRRPFSEAQLRRAAELVAAVAQRCGLRADQILLNRDVAGVSAPGRLIPDAAIRERDAALNADADFIDRYGQSRRTVWYLAAALAGLRRGDLVRLRWSSVDLADGTITITDGKARRTDLLPIHPQLAEALEAIRPRRMTPQALAQAKVFPHAVTNRTVAADFERAGIAPDAEGRIADLHALRTTLGTNLARRGVTPQVAQKIMRHADYRTTLACYTVLGLADTAAAVARLPGVGADEAREAATGTTGGPDATRVNEAARSGTADHQPYSQQLGRETPRSVATGRAGEGDGLATGNAPNSQRNAALRSVVRGDARMERRGLEPRTSSLQSWHSTN